MFRVDASVLRVTVVLNYTAYIWSGFRQVACAMGGGTRGAGFAWIFIGDTAAAERSLLTVSERGSS